MDGAEIASKAGEATAAIAGLIALAAPVTAPIMGPLAGLALAVGNIAKAVIGGNEAEAKLAIAAGRKFLDDVTLKTESHFEARNAATRTELGRLAREKAGTADSAGGHAAATIGDGAHPALPPVDTDKVDT